MLFGDKSNFAIEFNTINHSTKWGNGVIWINEQRIGDWDDPVFFDTLKIALVRISNIDDWPFDITSLKNPNTFRQFQNNIIQDKTLPGFPENFDKYDMRVFKQNNRIYFLWREMKWEKSEWVYKSDDVLLEDVSYDEYTKTIDVFSVYIDTSYSQT